MDTYACFGALWYSTTHKGAQLSTWVSLQRWKVGWLLRTAAACRDQNVGRLNKIDGPFKFCHTGILLHKHCCWPVALCVCAGGVCRAGEAVRRWWLHEDHVYRGQGHTKSQPEKRKVKGHNRPHCQNHTCIQDSVLHFWYSVVKSYHTLTEFMLVVKNGSTLYVMFLFYSLCAPSTAGSLWCTINFVLASVIVRTVQHQKLVFCHGRFVTCMCVCVCVFIHL